MSRSIRRSFVVLTVHLSSVIVPAPKRTASNGCLRRPEPIRGRLGRGHLCQSAPYVTEPLAPQSGKRHVPRSYFMGGTVPSGARYSQ